jgi:hypothetical protein
MIGIKLLIVLIYKTKAEFCNRMLALTKQVFNQPGAWLRSCRHCIKQIRQLMDSPWLSSVSDEELIMSPVHAYSGRLEIDRNSIGTY